MILQHACIQARILKLYSPCETNNKRYKHSNPVTRWRKYLANEPQRASQNDFRIARLSEFDGDSSKPTWSRTNRPWRGSMQYQSSNSSGLSLLCFLCLSAHLTCAHAHFYCILSNKLVSEKRLNLRNFQYWRNIFFKFLNTRIGPSRPKVAMFKKFYFSQLQNLRLYLNTSIYRGGKTACMKSCRLKMPRGVNKLTNTISSCHLPVPVRFTLTPALFLLLLEEGKAAQYQIVYNKTAGAQF